MNVIKTLWASVQGDPVFMRRVNGWLAVFWIVMIPVSMWQGWLNSVVYVSALSLWALVSGHWSAWQAARVEVRQHEDALLAEHRDVPAEVVDALIDRTTIDPAPSTSPSPSPSPSSGTSAVRTGAVQPGR